MESKSERIVRREVLCDLNPNPDCAIQRYTAQVVYNLRDTIKEGNGGLMDLSVFRGESKIFSCSSLFPATQTHTAGFCLRVDMRDGILVIRFLDPNGELPAKTFVGPIDETLSLSYEIG